MLCCHFRSEPPLSPRHHASIISNNHSSETLSSVVQNPSPSMVLRDTSIREPSSFLHGSSMVQNSGINSSNFSPRDRDNSSTYLNNISGSNNFPPFHNRLLLGSKENNTIVLRDNTPIPNASRFTSNRFLSGGLDQRIIKQSTEDCRRLLQQVSLILWLNYKPVHGKVWICLVSNPNSAWVLSNRHFSFSVLTCAYFRPGSQVTCWARSPVDLLSPVPTRHLASLNVSVSWHE